MSGSENDWTVPRVQIHVCGRCGHGRGWHTQTPAYKRPVLLGRCSLPCDCTQYQDRPPHEGP